MALRLLEMVLKEKDSGQIRELLKEKKILEFREVRLQGEEVFLRILLDAQENEPVLDLLEKHYAGKEESRVVILPVEATLPRPQVNEEEAKSDPKKYTRVGREELYEDIKDAAMFSWVYFALMALSTIVASVGLYQNSVTIIIGAMVISPMIGPSVAMSLATTLGDLPLLRKAVGKGLAGMAAAVLLALFLGSILTLDIASTEVVSRTQVGLGDVVVALASGSAGAFAFTTGVSAALIGVMVAVALLPPLVTFGMLVGNGQYELGIAALLLFLVNVVCVNLAGVTTFLVQGIRPITWWESAIAKKATCIAVGLWIVCLALLAALISLL